MRNGSFSVQKRALSMYPMVSPRHSAMGKSKRFRPKVMFLCAVARPRFDSNENCTFNGKLGIWPIVKTVLAKRTSVNRSAGAPELKPVSVTKPVYIELLQDTVIPSIYNKWPDRGRWKVFLQHDNTLGHRKVAENP